jgi:hypothetical protein
MEEGEACTRRDSEFFYGLVGLTWNNFSRTNGHPRQNTIRRSSGETFAVGSTIHPCVCNSLSRLWGAPFLVRCILETPLAGGACSDTRPSSVSVSDWMLRSTDGYSR